jgi:hypothetical protein
VSRVARSTDLVVVYVVSNAMGTSMQIGAKDGSELYSDLMLVARTKQEALALVTLIKDLAEDLPDPTRPGTPRVFTGAK